MRRTGVLAALFVMAALATAVPSPARAQAVDRSKPISIKTEKPPKPLTFTGVVLSSNVQSITVRSLADEKSIRTFTYSPGVRDKMLKILDQGGFQYGDKVEITADAGSDVALRIKGKPSKSL